MKPIAIWILAALATASCQTSDLQRAESIPVTQVDYASLATPQLMKLWLLEDCALPTDGKLVAVLRKRRAEVAPLLRRALDEGPPKELIAETEGGARVRFTKTRQALEDPQRLGLSDEDVKRASARTEAQFVARAQEGLEAGYRSQALLGLVAVLGAEANAIVDSIAADANSPARTTALLLQKKR